MLLQRRANGVDYYYFSLIKNSRCSSLLLKVSRNLHPFSFCAGHWKLLNHFFYFLVTCASYSHSRPFVLKDQKIHQEQQQQQNEMCKSRRFIIFFSSAAAAAAERRLFSRTSWQMDFRVIEWMCRWVEGTRMNRSCRCSCSLSLSVCLSISSVHSLILNRICVQICRLYWKLVEFEPKTSFLNQNRHFRWNSTNFWYNRPFSIE